MYRTFLLGGVSVAALCVASTLCAQPANRASAGPQGGVIGQPGAPTGSQGAQVSGAQVSGSGAANPGQQSVQIPIVKAEDAVAEGMARLAEPPFPPLNEAQQHYLDQVLAIWEQRTASIERYQCEMTRWQYDPTRDPEAATTIDHGVMQYASPDKGLFRIDDRQNIAKRGVAPEYRASERFGEYWICDGEYVYILDRNEKTATKIQLPPHQRGQAIQNSPLPFLFGVRAEEIKARYWIRPVRPPEGSKDVWLEAYPRRVDDAGNYSRVQVVLDSTELLPKALIVFLPNWEPQHPHREVYEFTNRKSNWSFLNALKQKLFMEEFIPTKLPSDWQIITNPYVEQPDGAAPGGSAPEGSAGAPRVAQPPSTPREVR